MGPVIALARTLSHAAGMLHICLNGRRLCNQATPMFLDNPSLESQAAELHSRLQLLEPAHLVKLRAAFQYGSNVWCCRCIQYGSPDIEVRFECRLSSRTMIGFKPGLTPLICLSMQYQQKGSTWWHKGKARCRHATVPAEGSTRHCASQRRWTSLCELHRHGCSLQVLLTSKQKQCSSGCFNRLSFQSMTFSSAGRRVTFR